MIKKELIPNLVTVGRGVMTILIVGLFYSQFAYRFQLILVLFILASLSDAVDGYLARKWKVVSNFGIVFDSMLDKVLVLSMLMMLVPFNLLPTIVFVLFLIRELVVDSIKNFISASGKPTGASMVGKLKMTTELIMIGSLIIRLFDEQIYWTVISQITAGVGLILAYWSAGIYINKWIKLTK